MERFKFSDILQTLEDFDAWLGRLGLTARQNDRIHLAFKFLERAQRETEKGRLTGASSPLQGDDLFPIIEAFESYEILSAFGEHSSPQLALAMKRALHGPLQPIFETDISREARNIWFELALGAEWKLRGASVEIAEPDLRLFRDDTVFLVACKRPAKEASVHANIRQAIRQLNATLESAPDGHFGVVAISMSKVLNAGDKFWSGSLAALGDRLESQMATFQPSWKSADSDPRIAAILFHVATPDASNDGVDLCRTTFTLADAVNDSVGTEIFKRFALEMKQHTSE